MHHTEITSGFFYNKLEDSLRDLNTACSIRTASSFAIPLSVLATLVDTVFGAVYLLIKLVKCGRDDRDFAKDHIFSVSHILARPYRAVLAVLNPNIAVMDFKNHLQPGHLVWSRGEKHGKEKGFLSSFVWQYFIPKIRAHSDKESHWAYRHITSRLLVIGFIATVSIARVADTMIALAIVPVTLITAIFTCKDLHTTLKCQSLYHLANRALQAPGVINDLFLGIFMIIHPSFSDFDPAYLG